MRSLKVVNGILVILFAVSIYLPAKKSNIPANIGVKLKIKDYRKYLNKKFKKRKRLSTKYIIIHTSEAGKTSTLRTLSRGKQVGKRRRTKGGHANYSITRDGVIFRILDHRYRADHTGLSMWNGLTDLSSHSIGIELVGFHYGTITFEQYRSLTPLLKELRRIYNIPERNILTHSQVSYGRPNLWFRKNHRGRKRCALNFVRLRAGLADKWPYDPDVRARRLTADYQIDKIFYKNRKKSYVKVAATKIKTIKKTSPYNGKNGTDPLISNIIRKNNTAWNIAGEDYNSMETIYILPEGKKIRGNSIKKEIGWGKLPDGTKVLLNQPKSLDTKKGPVFIITDNLTAWSYAGKEYKKNTTFYFFRGAGFKAGNKIKDWDSLPNGVKMIIGYRGPFPIGAKKGETPWGIAGKEYSSRNTIYLIPGKGLITGEKMNSFNNLPKYSKIFLK
ncbi:MAG: peptidoglycan recognition family protein [Acidobacteriota bacterium]